MAAFDTELLAREEVAEATMAFRLAKPADFVFKPGQSVNLALIDPPETDDKGNRRSFSIVSAPFEKDLLIAARMRDSAFKRVLKTLAVGTRLQLRGPAGKFLLDASDKRPAAFIAGGIGITPFLSMLRQAAGDHAARKLHLFYSYRRPEDAAFLPELLELQQRNPNYRLTATMTGMQRSDRPWPGERGHIDAAMLARVLGDVRAPIYFVAGSPALVDAMQIMLGGAGVKSEDIRRDEFVGY